MKMNFRTSTVWSLKVVLLLDLLQNLFYILFLFLFNFWNLHFICLVRLHVMFATREPEYGMQIANKAWIWGKIYKYCVESYRKKSNTESNRTLLSENWKEQNFLFLKLLSRIWASHVYFIYLLLFTRNSGINLLFKQLM